MDGRTAIFDLDGTLVDTSRDLIAAANACFEVLGEAPMLDPVGDAGCAFAGARAMLRLGFARLGRPEAEAEIEVWYPRLLSFYEAVIDRESRPYPGAMEAVERLRQAGWRVGVCTNKPEALAVLLMDRLRMREAFSALVAADTLSVRKPDPAPYLETVRRTGGDAARSFLLGDTVTDRDTARAAGVPIALVAFGPEGPGIARLAPDALLERYEDLEALAEGLVAAPR